jgi:hypothetical protein
MIILFAELLICIASLTIAFHHWRRYPILHAVINFRHFHWLALFSSLGIFTVGVAIFLFAGLLQFLDEHYFHSGKKLGAGFSFYILSIPILTAGLYLSLLCAVYCFLRLSLALLAHVHSFQSKPDV